mgnify:CR=1 FL=1
MCKGLGGIGRHGFYWGYREQRGNIAPIGAIGGHNDLWGRGGSVRTIRSAGSLSATGS